jgi:opacity protein-like surface antigen
MKTLCLFLLLLGLPLIASAQKAEFSGGWAHISGDGGVDGFDVGAAWWFTPRVSVGFDYDDTWDNSHIGIFELTSLGLIASKSHLQDALIGPRIFFPGLFKTKEKHIARLSPFAEAQFGMSILDSQLVEETAAIRQSASDTEFSWMLGGGADYRIASHWAGRLKVDLLRTHFADSGQSRARLVIGLVYTIGER